MDGSPNGTGDNFTAGVLIAATVSAVFSTALSVWLIVQQLRNYRKMHQQRWVVRILVMVPIYSVASCVSLFSVDAAFFIDLVRDLYEAFVIYCFFSLLVEYLGGERSLIIMLHGRPPTPHPWPIRTCFAPMDASDPYTFLALKRGILSYVQIKPVLAVLTVFLKATGTYNDGQLKADAGYTYISIVYNFAVSLSLYCLAMFWVCTHHDLKPYRPTPKFICVKGIIFFSFWQGFLISILVKAKVIRSTSISDENFSVACQDALICFEMVGFAILHSYAFDYRDYIDKQNLYAGRLPFVVAARDSLIGYKDVLQDSLTTLRGTGFSYRTFEPVEGGVHQGLGRERRVRAGLRYIDGGKAKRWLPMPGTDPSEAYGVHEESKGLGAFKHPFKEARRRAAEARKTHEGYAPLSSEQAQAIVHDAPDEHGSGVPWNEYEADESSSETSSLGFGAPNEVEEKLYEDSRQLEFGDYNYPVTDASKEEARRQMREDEEAIIRGWAQKTRPSPSTKGKAKAPTMVANSSSQSQELPDGCVDILVEDTSAEAALAHHDRHRGDPNHQGGRQKKVFRRVGGPSAPANSASMTGAKPRGAYVEEHRPDSKGDAAFAIGEDDGGDDGQQNQMVTANESDLIVEEVQETQHRSDVDVRQDDPWRTV